MRSVREYHLPITVFSIGLVSMIILVLIAGTNPPFHVMKDDSMIHRFNYNSWMDEFALCDGMNCTQELYLEGYGINKRSFLRFPYNEGFSKGTLLLFSKTKQVKQGDVVLIKENEKRKIVRILEINGNELQTKADMDPKISKANMLSIDEPEYLGKVWLKI